MDGFDEFHCISFAISFSDSPKKTSHCFALQKAIIMQVNINEMEKRSE